MSTETETKQSENRVEVTIEFETVVEDIADAWAFIMSRVERVGPDPQVHIHPTQDGPPPLLQIVAGMQVQEPTRKFHVSVKGTQTEAWDATEGVEVG